MRDIDVMHDEENMLMPQSTVSSRMNFTCRNDTMHNLTRDEADLAFGGLISERLRRASPVYYWRTSSQRHSRHEAVCSKRTKWHLLTFGSHGKWFDFARMKCRRAPKVGADSCTALSLKNLPTRWSEAHGVSQDVRGAGYWRWKPYSILKKLQAMEDGEVLAYMDYDLGIGRNLSALFCLGENAAQGVALFHFPCWTDRAWTKRTVTVALNATDSMLDTVQIYGGMVVIRKTVAAMAFVREWLRWVLGESWATDVLEEELAHQDAAFEEHRHDQSILSLLSKRAGIKSFPMPTALHDTGDRWAWDAGYCGITWPLPAARLPGGFYVNHYKEMGYRKDSAKLCMQTQRKPAPLTDYHSVQRPKGKLAEKTWDYVPKRIRERSSSSGIRAVSGSRTRRARSSLATRPAK